MPDAVERWLTELGVEPLERADREGVAAWDLRLDGRRRTDVRVTLILDPTLGAVVWVHYAPAITDGLRASYRRLLRWNDEFPFVKFALAEDGRPILAAEIPTARLDPDELGLCLARVLAVCDALLEESAVWLWPVGRRGALPPARSEAGVRLLEHFAGRLGEFAGEPPGGEHDPAPSGEARPDPATSGPAPSDPEPELAPVTRP